jgi:hypothetical protein
VTESVTPRAATGSVRVRLLLGRRSTAIPTINPACDAHLPMTTLPSIDSARFLNEQLSQASPDLMLELLTTFVNGLLSAQADAVCGAEYGTRDPDQGSATCAVPTLTAFRPAVPRWVLGFEVGPRCLLAAIDRGDGSIIAVGAGQRHGSFGEVAVFVG